MKRHSRGTAFDISIRGDELEHDRIQLEHNLQNTELSFRLSSTSDDENSDGYTHRQHRTNHRHHHQNSSLEYPRHISEPLVDFPSFAHRSREHFGDEDHSQMHAWSYRTGEDEDGINPYGGETVSTAAHHASAITISAGLGGGRAARRDPSLSGAEYDPERPLHAMIAGVNSKHSMFGMDSKNQAPENMTYDPLVVDSTAELDRILQSGHAPHSHSISRSVHPTPPTSSVSSDSEAAQTSSRPKLTDHLRHVSFSPKRPRSAQANHSNPNSPLARPSRNVEDRNASMNMPTPRPARRTNVTPSYASPVQPEVRLHPATPSSTGSRFTRMARGINKELEATQEQLNANNQLTQSTRPVSAPVERNPFHDGNQSAATSDLRSARSRRNVTRDSTSGKIVLPDVTGLTSAVESPAKPGMAYRPYKGDDRPRDSEARLLQTLSAVHGQLRDLDEENSISRRRVRELEMELEECKREVARERTRLFEREELSIRQHNSSYRGGSRSKGKGKAREEPPKIDDERLHARYKEAVEEKKEALINSLRSHLTRLTSELSSHQELLTELRKLRDSDAQALHEKGAEIIQLREEVQRLAGEVEVLRGVVEEGLKERRASREIQEVQVETSAADVAMSQDLDSDNSEEEEEVSRATDEDEEEEEANEQQENDDEPEPFDPGYYAQEESSPANPNHRADRTMRTDHATVGSTNLGESINGGPRFVDDEELDDIAAEVEERRANLSNGSIASRRRRSRSPSPVMRTNRATAEEAEDADERQLPASSRSQPQHSSNKQPESSTSRPSAPTPGHAARQYTRSRHSLEPEPETPFPQIRGEQLERLFFSAPEHNAKTCTVCYRRRYRTNTGTASPSWSYPKQTARNQGERHNQEEGQEDDEGFEEGSEEADAERAPTGTSEKGKHREYVGFSEDPAHWRQAGRKQGLPPQTVVARVIRELEDDFTHYKSIYVELADQYKVMDAVSDVPRRNTLARHLREVVDILEQKGDQIASLYDLLEFKDKPISESAVPDKDERPTSSWANRPASKRRGIS
ncbi:hypothetical protein GALMADRAFT_816004 [Galerina marginata CBS 339.88]|uniref:Cep57 centrosome microtubule-binding domain-containing protein n=1 Tax=Galerina marginata (strain CBS 339.88) TaxID=685588 RepID=A0A067TGG3_GALM3|nr:hypothetical protein GALMADRAFT_816004 [Galerina marginata CBS 339.88]